MNRITMSSASENVLVNVDTEQMQNSEKLLEIETDFKLNFKDQI